MSTIGDTYGPAMEIEDEEEARQYFERLVETHLADRPDHSRERAELTQRENLGYYAGYYNHETRLRVERLFGCQHPLLGPATGPGKTAEELIEMGRKLGERLKSKKLGGP